MKLKDENSSMLGKSIGFNSVSLGIFALVTAGTLALTYQLTKPRIDLAERKAAQKALLEIVPLNRHNNDLLVDTVPVPKESWALLGLKASGKIHIARNNQQAVAAIIPAVAPDGYGGAIKLIVGINRDGTVAGVRALSHRETPGLGDKVDLKRSDWILGFNDRSLSKPSPEMWKVKKDGGAFDQFTGATITPRAVVKQVRKTLEFVGRSQELLFESKTDSEPKSKSGIKAKVVLKTKSEPKTETETKN